MQTQEERHRLEHATWTYPDAPTAQTMDLPALLEEHSLATQRMCRAFDRGEIDSATHHRKYAASIVTQIMDRFGELQAIADRRAAA